MEEALVGFTTIAREPRLRLIMGLYCAQTLVAGALGVLVVVASIQLLDFGSAGVGYLNSAFGIGGLVGAAFAILLVARQRLASDFAIGTLLWGAPLILVGIFPSKATSLVLFALVGSGGHPSWRSQLRRCSSAPCRTRSSAASSAWSRACSTPRWGSVRSSRRCSSTGSGRAGR